MRPVDGRVIETECSDIRANRAFFNACSLYGLIVGIKLYAAKRVIEAAWFSHYAPWRQCQAMDFRIGRDFFYIREQLFVSLLEVIDGIIVRHTGRVNIRKILRAARDLCT